MTNSNTFPITIAFILGVFITLSYRNYQNQSTLKEILRLQIIQLKQDIENRKLEKEILLKYKQEAANEQH